MVEFTDKLPRFRVSLYLDTEIFQRLQGEADKLGISINAFMRMVLADYFDGITFTRQEKTGEK